ncbi:MAG: glycogen(starch) synthase [Cyclobacteriaceae bacterium]|jgi:glycogen(starch) synthase
MERKNKKELDKTILTEVAWEVCNQVGGIYTVIRSKVPVMIDKWGDNYLLLGPYIHHNVASDFESAEKDDSNISKAVEKLREMGLDVHYGRWLVSGRPRTVLFNPFSAMHELGNIKYFYNENHHIDFKNHDELVDQVLAFGYMVKLFLSELARESMNEGTQVLAHFHEWMAGTAIPDIRKEQIPIRTVFTTHATMLGRYLAMNDPFFYDHLPFVNWEDEAKNFNIDAVVRLERACAHGSHIFTTVSDVTGKECVHLLGRAPDQILPNGLNIDRFSVLHEVQNIHQNFKTKIRHFVMGHFFQSYSFDLDKTLFFFTSGRFEYRNKGYDLALEALAKLNWKMKEANSDMTVVMFIVTKQPVHSISPHVLNSRAVMEEIDHNCDAILAQVKERLFEFAAGNQGSHKLPPLNDMVDDYWRLRYRRTIQSWKSENLPSIVTHNLVDDANDPVLNFLRHSNLINNADDKVKFVYHPDFISSTNPLFGMDYGEFVRGCHLGVFPSYYEPWGYTPVECLASGVSAVTSDLSGFGDYIKNVPTADEEHGMYVVDRATKDFNGSADDLADILMKVVNTTRKDRINTRNKSEDLSECFDWKNLYSEYEKAYLLATAKLTVGA